MSASDNQYEAIVYFRVADEEYTTAPTKWRYDGFKITAPASNLMYSDFLAQVRELATSAPPRGIVVAPGWSINKV